MYERKSQVNFRVNEEKKANWETFVEKSEYSSISHFLRRAAEKEKARHENENQEKSESEVSSEQFESVTDHLEQISTRLQSIDRRLSSIEADQYGDEDLAELANDVYQVLPSSVNEIQIEQSRKMDGKDANTGSIADIARKLNADKSAVEMAIERLKNTTYAIRETENDAGITSYYKRGGN